MSLIVYLLIIILADGLMATEHDSNTVSSSQIASNRIIGKMRQDLDTLQKLMNILKGKCDKAVTKDAYGAVYVRWGHDRCPGPHSRRVYSGFVGGAHYSYSGGAADYLCLTRNPRQSTDKRNYTSGYGYLYGAEYEFGKSNSKSELDVVCAVCQSVGRPDHIMLPGSDVCPEGWYPEYKGLLMSGYYKHAAASQHVCVDNAQRKINGGQSSQNGKLFYPLKTECGSLKCPPYKQNQLVTCSVCTR